MAAKWVWNSTGIFVSEYDQGREVKRAELNKLDATSSTFHYFGAASKKMRIKGLVIGTTDRDAIESDAINNVPRTFTTPWESLASCLINGEAKFSALKYSGATIDGVSYTSSVTPIYQVELEIIV
jgi:hypothetical protein